MPSNEQEYLIKKTTLDNIAGAIHNVNEESAAYSPATMVDKIAALKKGETRSVTLTANPQTFNPTKTNRAMTSVEVTVQGGEYSASVVPVSSTSPKATSNIDGDITNITTESAPSGEYYTITPKLVTTNGSEQVRGKATISKAGYINVGSALSNIATFTSEVQATQGNTRYLAKGAHSVTVIIPSSAINPPAVTPSVNGTIGNIWVTSVTSGVDGIDYWTITPGGTKTKGRITAKGHSSIDKAGYLPIGTADSTEAEVELDADVNNGTSYYIKHGAIKGSVYEDTGDHVTPSATPSIGGTITDITYTNPPSVEYYTIVPSISSTSSGHASVFGKANVTTAGYLAVNEQDVSNVLELSFPVTENTGTTRYLAKGALDATTTSTSSGSATIATDGFTASSGWTPYKVTLSTSSGSVSYKGTVSIAGYVKADATSGVKSATVTVTPNLAQIYIPEGSYYTNGGVMYNAEAGITANGFDAATSATSHYITLSTSAGRGATGAYIDAAGYIPVGELEYEFDVPVSVTGNVTRINIPDGSAATPSGKTITASISLSNVYTSNKGYKLTASGNLSITPTVTAGYVTSGTAAIVYVGDNGNTYVAQNSFATGTAPSGATVNAITLDTVYKLSAGYYHADRYYKATSIELTGDATAADVLSGKTFYSNTYTQHRGSMRNNGRIIVSLGYGGSYTVPEGYTSGGTVSTDIGAAKVSPNSYTITPNNLEGEWNADDNKFYVSQQATTVADAISISVDTAGYISDSVGTRLTSSVSVKAPDVWWMAGSGISKSSTTPSTYTTLDKNSYYYISAGYCPGKYIKTQADTPMPVLTGDATKWDVRYNKTFYSNDYNTKITGAMYDTNVDPRDLTINRGTATNHQLTITPAINYNYTASGYLPVNSDVTGQYSETITPATLGLNQRTYLDVDGGTVSIPAALGLIPL